MARYFPSHEPLSTTSSLAKRTMSDQAISMEGQDRFAYTPSCSHATRYHPYLDGHQTVYHAASPSRQHSVLHEASHKAKFCTTNSKDPSIPPRSKSGCSNCLKSPPQRDHGYIFNDQHSSKVSDTSRPRRLRTEADRYQIQTRNRARSNEQLGAGFVPNSNLPPLLSPPPDRITMQIHPTDYILTPLPTIARTFRTHHNIFEEPVELEVRGRNGVTAQVRQDLALGRLFGIMTVFSLSPTADTSPNENQHVAALSPVPALDDGSHSENPPPPFVIGTLTFRSLYISLPGTWRIRVTLFRVNDTSGALHDEEDGATSLEMVETDIQVMD